MLPKPKNDKTMTRTPSPRKRKRTVKVLLAVVALAVVGTAAGMWRAVFGPSLQAPEEGLAVYVPTGTTPRSWWNCCARTCAIPFSWRR